MGRLSFLAGAIAGAIVVGFVTTYAAKYLAEAFSMLTKAWPAVTIVVMICAALGGIVAAVLAARRFRFTGLTGGACMGGAIGVTLGSCFFLFVLFLAGAG